MLYFLGGYILYVAVLGGVTYSPPPLGVFDTFPYTKNCVSTILRLQLMSKGVRIWLLHERSIDKLSGSKTGDN